MLFDDLAAVERVHDQQSVGAVQEVFVLQPAVAVVQRIEDAEVDTGAETLELPVEGAIVA